MFSKQKFHSRLSDWCMMPTALCNELWDWAFGDDESSLNIHGIVGQAWAAQHFAMFILQAQLSLLNALGEPQENGQKIYSNHSSNYFVKQCNF